MGHLLVEGPYVSRKGRFLDVSGARGLFLYFVVQWLCLWRCLFEWAVRSGAACGNGAREESGRLEPKTVPGAYAMTPESPGWDPDPEKQYETKPCGGKNIRGKFRMSDGVSPITYNTGWDPQKYQNILPAHIDSSVSMYCLGFGAQSGSFRGPHPSSLCLRFCWRAGRTLLC